MQKSFWIPLYENREIAVRPQSTLDNYSTFPEEYTSYFNDNLQFRNNLISLNSGIDYFCFRKSSSHKVAIGKERWLFYSHPNDGDLAAILNLTKQLCFEDIEYSVEGYDLHDVKNIL